MERISLIKTLASFIVAAVVYLIPLGLEGKPHIMLFVMTFIVLLWITEAAPLHATALFTAFLIILIVGLDAKEVFAQYFDPVIVLLLGGFVIAVAMSKYKLDEYMAYKIIGKAGNNPNFIVLALLSTAAFISMWISNSATAAIIMPIALVILSKNALKPGMTKFGKACVLAVGYGATIGGVGTIIGSTPNIIAAKYLQSSGVAFGFYEWLYRGFPLMLLLIIAGWLVLIALFKPEKNYVKSVKVAHPITNDQKKVMAIFVLTVILWITENIHGVSNSVMALVPIILFYFSGLLSTEDFTRIDWPTLVLIGGGLALGMGIHATTLDASFASLLSSAILGQNIFMLFLLLGLFGVLLTVFISNTTAAAVYLPLVVALGSSIGGNVTNIVVVASLGVSLDFIFPFGTPPTAIAYGTRYVKQKDIALAGIVISGIGIVLLMFLGTLW